MSGLLRAQQAVAIDGPAGSGKSSVARRLAAELGLAHVDTGAMYRAVALLALREQIDPEAGEALAARLAQIEFRFEAGRLQVDGVDVESEIRGAEVTALVSTVAAHARVRAEMMRRQRALATQAEQGCVLEGRDIGSAVLPLSQRKLYLFADPTERARRRALQTGLATDAESLARLEEEIVRRDRQDEERESSPLRIAPDAHVVDTTEIDEDETVRRCLALLRPEAPDEAARRRMQHHRKRSFLYGLAQACITRPFVYGLYGMRVFGRENELVDGGVIYASNHISNYDPPVVGTAVDREVHFLAKKELFTPLLGPVIRTFNAIPLDRSRFDSKAFEVAERELRAGNNIMIFPEGTRRPVGNPGPIKKGLGILTQRSGRPYLPLLIRGTEDMGASLRRRGSLEAWIGPPTALRAAEKLRETLSDAEIHARVGDLFLQQLRALDELATAHSGRP